MTPRTAGPLAFTFYDRTGAAIPQGTIRTDGTSDFGKFFQASDAGGLFLGDYAGLTAVDTDFFPYYALAIDRATNPSDVYFAQVGP